MMLYQTICLSFPPDWSVPDVSASPLGAICDSGGPGTRDGVACWEAAFPSRARCLYNNPHPLFNLTLHRIFIVLPAPFPPAAFFLSGIYLELETASCLFQSFFFCCPQY